MLAKRHLVHTGFLLLLPVIVAWFGLSTLSAIALVLLALLWRWLISLSLFAMPVRAPKLVLDSISASHFVEKVRWSMDRANIDYVENASGGTLGAFFAGRTVPRLRFRSGAVRSQIGNSPEILRYLWGAYAADTEHDVSHLEPTAERLEFERRCDRYGVNLQVWVYYLILPHREFTLRIWGADSAAVPAWQRVALRALFPVLRQLIRWSFRINEANFSKACNHIESFLAEADATLGDNRASILGGDALNYTDFAFAAMTGLWLQPPNYSGGKASFIASDRDQLPTTMREHVERWEQRFPTAVDWVQNLYAEERL